MKKLLILAAVTLLFLLAFSAIASEQADRYEKYTLWFGGHYIDSTDYNKKVGEYRWLEEDTRPEFGLTYQSMANNSTFYLDGHYFDKKTMHGLLSTRVGDQFKGSFRYRAFRRHTGQDLLENAQAREWLGDAPGGKMLTHEIQDMGADYSYDRREVLSEVSVLLSRRNDVRLTAAHRAILKDGHEQSISNSHCFSCHIVSQEARVENRTHDLWAGIDAELGKLDVGYKFGYRLYESSAPTPQAYYDEAKHPVNGGSGAEFASRLNYSDSILTVGQEPKTEKMTHKVRVKGDAGEGRFASALAYTTAKNKLTDLKASTWAGTFNYTVPLSPRSRLIARLAVSGIDADDPFVDVKTHREGRPGVVTDFDFTRYSALDRTTADFTAEFIHRLSPKMVLSLLGGFNRVDRTDYAMVDDGITSTTFTGQAKLQYRKGMRYNTTLRARYEKTSDPFVSGRGLFEANGSELLEPQGTPPAPSFYYYWQREELRYQNITTEPTDFFEVQWRSIYRPTNKVSLNLTATGSYDKNGDLDSLDVEHTKLLANASFTLIPDMRWSVTGGVGYNYQKSRGPVAVALFDG